jgi:hypothetical protein
VAPAPFGSSRKASSCAQRTHRWDGSTRLILAELILVMRLQPDQVLDSPRPSEVARRLGWVFVLVAFERLWNPVACLSFPRCHLSIGSAAIANAGQGSGLSQPECCVGQQDIAVVNQPLIHDFGDCRGPLCTHRKQPHRVPLRGHRVKTMPQRVVIPTSRLRQSGRESFKRSTGSGSNVKAGATART